MTKMTTNDLPPLTATSSTPHRLRITRSQPASGLRSQPELCQQAAGVADLTAQNGVAVVADAVGMVSG